MPASLRSVLALTGLALSPVCALAQEVMELDEITVATAPAAQAAPSETVVGAEQLATEYQGAGLETILRDVPGVTPIGGGAEGGEMAVSIRGLQDHGRVAVTVDGMRQNFARSGHGANGTFSVDQEMLREIVVTRGPGAKAGAIGGAVALRRVTAADLLRDGARTGGELRLRYGTLSRSPTVHGAVAARLSEAVDVMVAATHAEADDYAAPDGTPVYAWQQTRSGLATLGFTTETGQRVTLSADRTEKDYYTGVSTGAPRDNDMRTSSFRFGYEAPDLLGWMVEATLYDTNTRLAQKPLSAGLLPAGAGRSYDTRTTGLLLTGQRYLDFGGFEHDVTVTLEGFRDSAEVDDPSGSLTPSGDREFWSLGLEDRVALGWGTLTLGLSAGSYRLSSASGSASGEQLSPRVAVEVPLGNWFTLHAVAAMAYRPPSLNETLVSGMHPEPADFPIRPNPDLRPETSRSFELGLGYGYEGLLAPGDTLDIRATVFRNTVDDYIGLERVGGLFDAYYQYNNIERVRIEGLELEARYDAGRVFAGLAGQILDGTDLSTGAELNRTAPDRLVLTAGLRSADMRREAGTRITLTGAKAGSTLSTESWSTVDLFFTQDIGDRATFGLTLNNILDENYTPYLDTQSQPGFNAQASLTVRF